MLLTAAGIAFARKIRDEKKRKQHERQGALDIGNSEMARRAFASQANNVITSAGEPGANPGTELAIQGPDSLDHCDRLRTASTFAHGSDDRHDCDDNMDTRDRLSSRLLVSSGSQTATSRDSRITQPPPYSPGLSTSGIPTPATMTTLGLATTLSGESDGSSSIFSDDSMALKIKSRGPDLKSGFAYHPGLYDLKVTPEMWQTFNQQIVEATKFGAGDTARVWAAATATALTGAVVTAAYVGSLYKRSIVEKKIQQGLKSGSEGGLGETLAQWNDTYFRERGLLATLQMSEAAQKRAECRGPRISFRSQAMLFSTKEEREARKEEQKYIIVISKLDDIVKRLEAMAGLQDNCYELSLDRTDALPELPARQDPIMKRAEMPTDDASTPVELPAIVRGLAGTQLMDETGSDLPAELSAELPGDMWRAKEGKPSTGMGKHVMHEPGAT